MLKNINAIKVINSNLFIREPVDDLCKMISNKNSKRIILTGGRGAGKSIILYNSERKNLGNENQTIYMRFDPIKLFPKHYNEIFDKKFIDHYYELVFCHKILNYIETNYSLTYEKYFKDFEILLHDYTTKANDYINNSIFEKVTLDNYLKPNEISGIILLKLKRFLNISSLSLAIDRFDWTNESTALIQNTLCKFFDVFDKTIITTDDETLDSDNRAALIEKGYSFVTTQYGKNFEVVKQIIKKRIKHYNMHLDVGKNTLPEDIINDEDITYLIIKANGNISLILSCINDIISEWEWEKEKSVKDIAKITDYRLIKTKNLKTICNHPKLYL